MWEVRRHRQACASCRARVSLRVAATLVVRLVTTGPACPSRRVSTPWMCVCVWEHGVPHQGSRQVRPGGYSPHSWSGRDELGADPSRRHAPGCTECPPEPPGHSTAPCALSSSSSDTGGGVARASLTWVMRWMSVLEICVSGGGRSGSGCHVRWMGTHGGKHLGQP